MNLRKRVVLIIVAMFLVMLRVAALDRAKMRSGDAYLTRGEFGKARRCWDQAWGSRRKSADYFLRLASSYALEGSFARANTVMSEAEKRYPGELRIKFHRALLAVRMQDDAKAEKLLTSLSETAPWYPGVYYILGTIYERKGELKLAKQMYVKELNVNCVNTEAWHRLLELDGSKPGKVVYTVAWITGAGSLLIAVALLVFGHSATGKRLISS